MKTIDWKSTDTRELAGFVSSHFRKHNIDAVLSGGACVCVYSENRYVSYDLDYVTFATIGEVKAVLSRLGYEKGRGRHFEHPECSFVIDLLPGPVSIGSECPIARFSTIKTKWGPVRLLRSTDCVKDRLAAYFHWNDPQALEQAVLVAKSRKIDLQEVKKWAMNEGAREKYRVFAAQVKRKGSRTLSRSRSARSSAG